jgi:biopolymer transport protein ExbB/TolQ
MSPWLQVVLSVLTPVIAVASMLRISRNARSANAIQKENLELNRIGRLRSELDATESKLTAANRQMEELLARLAEANDRAITSARREAEMLRYARMPGTTMVDWLRRFDPDGTHEISQR